MPTGLPHWLEASHTPILMLNVKQEAVNTDFKVFDLTRPGIEHIFSIKLFLHLTTDRCRM